jgi:hypothetical protein
MFRLRRSRTRDRHPSEGLRAEQQRRRDDGRRVHAAGKGAERFRQPRIVVRIFDRLGPAAAVLEQMAGEILTGGTLRGLFRFVRLPAVLERHEQVILHVDHPQVAARAGFVDQPHAARMALALLDHLPGQRAEEAVDIGFTNEQRVRELRDLGLHVGAAFGAAPLG